MGIMGRVFKNNESNYYDNEIGILFDIDDLGGGFYGGAAFKIFFRNIDPDKISPFQIHDGDTEETLQGRARHYCIAVTSGNTETIAYIKDVFTNADDKGLVELNKRFIIGDSVLKEPLVFSASASSVDGKGIIKYIDGVYLGIKAGLEGSNWGSNVRI